MVKGINRRGFCAGSGALIGLTVLNNVGGCGNLAIAPLPPSDGAEADLDAPSDPSDMAAAPPPGPDLEAPPPPLSDLSHLPDPPDLSPACAVGARKFSAGPAKAIVVNTATFLSSFDYRLFLCRDAGGIFALTAVCTHMGCIVDFQSGPKHFFCACHGSTFSFNGAVLVQPAQLPLVHYVCCLDGAGNVIVNYGMQVAAAARL